MRFLTFLCAIFLSNAAIAFQFEGIGGEVHNLEALKGQPVLVVNTASRCAFTNQYNDLQSLYDTYRTQGLVVLAVPSNDFRQELATAEQVKEFCAVNFNLDIPMTTLSKVSGTDAHPFYAWVKQQSGFQPKWNFNKVLLDKDGNVASTYGSTASPTGKRIISDIEDLLSR